MGALNHLFYWGITPILQLLPLKLSITSVLQMIPFFTIQVWNLRNKDKVWSFIFDIYLWILKDIRWEMRVGRNIQYNGLLSSLIYFPPRYLLSLLSLMKLRIVNELLLQLIKIISISPFVYTYFNLLIITKYMYLASFKFCFSTNEL